MTRVSYAAVRIAATLLVAALLPACGYLPISRMSLSGTDALESTPKPSPVDSAFGSCGADGSQPDYVLNRLKNRVDAGPWIDTPWQVIARLPWPREAALRFRNQWTVGEQLAVARYEGAPVRIEGYLLGYRLEGREPPNCYSDEPGARDFHMWLADQPGVSRKRAIVVEITPRVRVHHPSWTAERLAWLRETHDPIRVSGWLMLDQMHPERVGGNRQTLWEVHPILGIEVKRAGTWVPLDSIPLSESATVEGPHR
jgi:hypothetical protein